MGLDRRTTRCRCKSWSLAIPTLAPAPPAEEEATSSNWWAWAWAWAEVGKPKLPQTLASARNSNRAAVVAILSNFWVRRRLPPGCCCRRQSLGCCGRACFVDIVPSFLLLFSNVCVTFFSQGCPPSSFCCRRERGPSCACLSSLSLSGGGQNKQSGLNGENFILLTSFPAHFGPTCINSLQVEPNTM